MGEDEDMCWLLDCGEKLPWKWLMELLWELLWEFIGDKLLLCFGDMDWFDKRVEFGDAELSINDLDGVECTELMAARYWNENIKQTISNQKQNLFIYDIHWIAGNMTKGQHLAFIHLSFFFVQWNEKYC